MKSLTPHFLAAAVLMTGCASFGPGSTQPIAAHGAKLVLSTRVTGGGYSVASVVAPYTKASVNHLVLKLFTLSGNTETAVSGAGGSPTTLDLGSAQLSTPITFGNLHANTTYRIRAYAYKNAGTAASDLISTADADSYVDVTLTDDDRPTMATLQVRLIDVTFSGSATSSQVTVTPGGYSAIGTESIGLGSDGTLGARVTTNALSPALGAQSVVRLGNYVYQLGGNTSSGRTTAIQQVTLDANGLVGNFATDPDSTLATAVDMAEVAVVGSKLYVLGGRDGSGGPITAIQQATINSDGTIGTFSTQPGTTSTARDGAAIYVSDSYVYLIGGHGTSGTLASIERAAINGDGSLGTFATVSATLSAPRQWCATAVMNGFLYLIGGAGSGGALATLERAPINGDGTLGAFESVASQMTIGRNAPTAAVIGSNLYVLGGWGPSTLQNGIERAPINADGSIGSFAVVNGITLSSARYTAAGLLVGDQYYVFGGDDGSVACTTNVDRFPIN